MIHDDIYKIYIMLNINFLKLVVDNYDMMIFNTIY